MLFKLHPAEFFLQKRFSLRRFYFSFDHHRSGEQKGKVYRVKKKGCPEEDKNETANASFVLNLCFLFPSCLASDIPDDPNNDHTPEDD